MKKKSLLFFPILGAFLLSGCDFSLESLMFWKNTNQESNQQQNENKDNNPDEKDPDITPDEIHTHATSMSIDPSAPFYLMVGEKRSISVTLSPSPDQDDEKECKWNLSGDYIEYEIDSKNSRKVTVTGKTPGTAKLTATNTYNEGLTKTFTIKVIDFNEATDYLWQYQSSDRAQFGYVYKEKPAGDPSGVAKLNGMSWSYKRTHKVNDEEVEYASSLQSSMGAVGFGKGEAPETHIHFETENDRLVNAFTIEAASAHDLAKMTIKVGDTVYMNEKVVPRASYDVVGTLKTDEVTPATGKIEIDVYTPEYSEEEKLADPDNYVAPGAFYLKSILINYNDAAPDKTVTLVKDASEIEQDERYLVVSRYVDENENAKYKCLNGTGSTKDGILNGFDLEDFAFGDSVSVSSTFDKYGFNASFDENDKLNFANDADYKIGLTKSGDLTAGKTPAITGWDYEVAADNHLVMTMYDQKETPRLRYFAANEVGVFKAYASDKENIFLFKF